MLDRYIVSEQVAERRRAICQSCEHKTMIGTCGICKCVIRAKTRLALSSCPLNKWSKENEPSIP
nr:MAG TPA: hypothetical protein [Caudoviricetes sp.]